MIIIMLGLKNHVIATQQAIPAIRAQSPLVVPQPFHLCAGAAHVRSQKFAGPHHEPELGTKMILSPAQMV